MRTWTLRSYWKNNSVWSRGEGREQWMVLRDDVRVAAVIDTLAEAQFIVDACNAAEQLPFLTKLAGTQGAVKLILKEPL